MKCCWTFKYEYICIIDGKVCCLYLGMLLGYCRLDQEYTDLMLCLYLDYVYKYVCVSECCVHGGGDMVYNIGREEVCENYYSCLKCEPIYYDNELIHVYHEFTLPVQEQHIVLLDIYVVVLVLLSVNITIKYAYICEKHNVTIIETQCKLIIYVLHINSMSHWYYYLFITIVLIILYSCIHSHEHVTCKSLCLSKGKMKGGGNLCTHLCVFLTYRDLG